MKISLVTFIILLLNLSSFAQENFEISDSRIQWQKVFDTDLDKETIQSIITKDAILSPIAADFNGVSSAAKVNCDDSQPVYMREPMQFFVSIEFKSNRYQVTVSKVEFLPTSSMEVMGVETTTQPVAWEDYIVKKSGEFRSNKMATNSRTCLDGYFTKLFTFEKSNSDW